MPHLCWFHPHKASFVNSSRGCNIPHRPLVHGMPASTPSFLSLPTELRLQCLGYVFTQPPNAGFIQCEKPSVGSYHGLLLDSNYSASSQLNILLTCRQFRADFTCLAFSITTFIVKVTSTSLTAMLQPLQDHQLSNLRKVAIEVSPERMRELVSWESYPFDRGDVRLRELIIVLQRTGRWHYPAQYTRELVALTRRLRNVEVLRFVRNSAYVNGSFRPWYHRLVGLILKEDHYQRYDAPNAPLVEATWWVWSYDYFTNSFQLLAQPPKPVMPEPEYIEMVAPMVRGLMGDRGTPA